VPKITLRLPVFTPILRTTAGVKPLTHADSEWDKADTGRTLEGAPSGSGSFEKKQNSGVRQIEIGGVLSE